jgi:hypothetical protein
MNKKSNVEKYEIDKTNEVIYLLSIACLCVFLSVSYADRNEFSDWSPAENRLL